MNAPMMKNSLPAPWGLLVLVLVLSPAPEACPQAPDGIAKDMEVMPWQDGEVVRDEALIQFKAGVPAAERAALHGRLGCTVIEVVAEGLDRIDLEGTPLQEAINAYGGESIVAYAEPHVVYRPYYIPNDPSWNQQWGPKNIKCPAAWDIHMGGASSVVAVLDSSVDYTHPDLAGHYQYGHDYFNGDNDPYEFFDFIGHGTHCSGIAAAVTNNGTGIAGVGFDCKFAFYQVGSIIIISDSAVIQAINDTVSRGWHVISMSFGGAQSSQSMQNALTSATNAGVVCVAAAGNDGNTQIGYPAGYPNVIAVASHNQNNAKSSFSTYGSWVDVSAPGEGIYSTIYTLWGGYTNMDGTSMACPHVAGMANILYSLIGGDRNKANGDLIRAAIQDSCVPASWVKHGRVDLEGAMKLLTATDPPVIHGVDPSTVQAFSGGTITVTGQHFSNVTEVNSGGTVLTPPAFTIVDDGTITYSAPNANALGPAEVTATNPAGTSNPGYFTYVETDPPKLHAPAITGAGSWFEWSFGGGAHDLYFLLISVKNATFPYHGFDVLAYFRILYKDNLGSAGLGGLQAQIPSGLQGLTFYSQVVTFDPQFVGASNIRETLIVN